MPQVLLLVSWTVQQQPNISTAIGDPRKIETGENNELYL